MARQGQDETLADLLFESTMTSSIQCTSAYMAEVACYRHERTLLGGNGISDFSFQLDAGRAVCLTGRCSFRSVVAATRLEPLR